MKYFLLLCVSYFYLNADAHIFVYHRFGDDKHQSTNTTIKELEKELYPQILTELINNNK